MGLPLAMTAQTFTQWVQDVDEEVSGLTPLQPVGGLMRRKADGVLAKMLTRQNSSSRLSGTGVGDTSHEAAAALLALGHNKDSDLLEGGALLAAQGDAGNAGDAVLQLAALSFLCQLADRSGSARGLIKAAGIPQQCEAATQSGDPMAKLLAARLLHLA